MTEPTKEEIQEALETVMHSNVFIKPFAEKWDMVEEVYKYETDEDEQLARKKGFAKKREFKKQGYYCKLQSTYIPYLRGGIVKVVGVKLA